jgi:tetratricopeptide (TPR) repeat protein
LSQGLRSSLLVFALLGCATPQGPLVDTADWFEVRASAFTISSNLGRDELRELAGELALFDAAVRKVTNTRIDKSAVPIRLYIMRDEAQAKRFMPSYAAGVIYPRLDGYFSLLRGDHPAWTRQVLLHEYAHYVLRGDRRMAFPLWYDEGLSEFLAYMRLREDVIILGRTATSHMRQLHHWGPMPLAELFGLEGSAPVNLSQFYATAWALSHYLNTSKALNAQSRGLVRRLVRGDDWRSAFDASFEITLEELEASLALHIDYLERGGRRDFQLPLSALEVPNDFKVTEVPPAEIAYQLGMLVRRISGPEPEPKDLIHARALFELAVATDPEHRRAAAALAWTWAAAGRFEKARSHVGAAEGEASSDPRLALDLARIAALQASTSESEVANAEAKALLERAIALAPEQPDPHAELARHFIVMDERDAAISSFEHARKLGAWSPTLDVELARQYLEGGARKRAISLLQPVAADLHGGAPAKEAQELLEELQGER